MLYKRSGFSLIEITIVLSITAIIMVCTVPLYQFLIDRTDSRIESEKLKQAISLARSEAIRLGEPIVICGSHDQQTCADHWYEGYIIRSNDRVLHSFPSKKKGSLYWRGSLRLTYLKFLPTGFLNTQDGTFWYCLSGKVHPSWALVINHSGRARSVKPDHAYLCHPANFSSSAQ